MKVEFVSYDGEYPNLCSGTSVLALDGNTVTFPSFCLCSGGNAGFDADWNDWVKKGPWSVSEWPEDFPEEAKDAAVACVNANVPFGCCGGCL